MGDLGALFGSLNPGDVGFGALVVAAVWLIFTGRLVPRSTVDSMRAEYESSMARMKAEVDAAAARFEEASNRVLEEKKEWKEAYHLEHSAREKLGEQLGELIEYAETADHLIRSVTTEPTGVGRQSQ